jgi:amidase
MMEELLFNSAHQLAALIRQRQIETYLAQISRCNAALNAIIYLDDEGARQRAREADKALASGRTWGPLHGVPFTLKDHQDTVGLPSTMGGYPPFRNRLPEKDGTVANRLKSAGGILLGKSNAVFFPFGIFGPSNNPWDLTRCPGVSSSGAAAALAAGLTPLDVGTDTSGSVLLPAHNCGIYGMRPTEGRVPLTGLTDPWSLPPAQLLTVFGPMARSVDDLKLVLKIIAGPDGRDPHVPPVPWREVRPPSISELRIAWTPSFPGAEISDAICLAIEILAAELEGLGAKTRCCRPAADFVRQAEISRLILVYLMLHFVNKPGDQEARGQDSPSLADYLQLLGERDQFILAWEELFSDWDALLCPVCGVPAQPHGDEMATTYSQAADQDAVRLPLRLTTVTGHPSVVIPLTRLASGLPVGAQLIGPRWQDERLLGIAEVISEISGGYARPPAFGQANANNIRSALGS